MMPQFINRRLALALCATATLALAEPGHDLLSIQLSAQSTGPDDLELFVASPIVSYAQTDPPDELFVASPLVSYQLESPPTAVFVASPIVSYQQIAPPTQVFAASPVVSYQQIEYPSELQAFSRIVSYYREGENVQPQPGQDVPDFVQSIVLDHLWQWDDSAGRFVDPGSNGVTIDPNKPTYLLTHGWDGTLDGVSVGEQCDDPNFSMSTIGCAIWDSTSPPEGTGANLLAWDWKVSANPNSRCDFLDAFIDDTGQVLLRSVVRMLVLPTTWPSALTGVLGGEAIVAAKIVLDARNSGQAAGNEGNRLGRKLAQLANDHPEWATPLGSELHLVGKSHGGGVLGRAAAILAQMGHPPTTLTTLDTPKIGCATLPAFCLPFLGCYPEREGCLVNSLQYVDPNAAGHTTVTYYPQTGIDLHGRALGVGAPIDASPTLTNLALNADHAPWLTILHLWISGYDPSDEGACPQDDGWYPNGVGSSVLFWFDNEPVPNALLDTASIPSGCFEEWSVTPYQFIDVGCLAPAKKNSGGLVGSGPGLSLIRFEPFTSAATWFGEYSQVVEGIDPVDPTNKVVRMEEQLTEASFFREIAWPTNAIEVAFEYMFSGVIGDETLTVYLKDDMGYESMVYYDSALTSLAFGHLTSSSAIYVGDLAGRTARFNFVFRTDGTPSSQLLIDNIRVFGVVLGDSDLDGDVDLSDISTFQGCFGEGASGQISLQCLSSNVVVDEAMTTNQVDDSDYSLIQTRITGPTITPIP